MWDTRQCGPGGWRASGPRQAARPCPVSRPCAGGGSIGCHPASSPHRIALFAAFPPAQRADLLPGLSHRTRSHSCTHQHTPGWRFAESHRLQEARPSPRSGRQPAEEGGLSHVLLGCTSALLEKRSQQINPGISDPRVSSCCRTDFLCLLHSLPFQTAYSSSQGGLQEATAPTAHCLAYEAGFDF